MSFFASMIGNHDVQLNLAFRIYAGAPIHQYGRLGLDLVRARWRIAEVTVAPWRPRFRESYRDFQE